MTLLIVFHKILYIEKLNILNPKCDEINQLTVLTRHTVLWDVIPERSKRWQISPRKDTILSRGTPKIASFCQIHPTISYVIIYRMHVNLLHGTVTMHWHCLIISKIYNKLIKHKSWIQMTKWTLNLWLTLTQSFLTLTKFGVEEEDGWRRIVTWAWRWIIAWD